MTSASDFSHLENISMATLPLDKGRSLNGSRQRRVFRATGSESIWMDEFEAAQTVARRPSEWSLEPFGGQTYGAVTDPWAVEARRGSVEPIEDRANIAVKAW